MSQPLTLAVHSNAPTPLVTYLHRKNTRKTLGRCVFGVFLPQFQKHTKNTQKHSKTQQVCCMYDRTLVHGRWVVARIGGTWECTTGSPSVSTLATCRASGSRLDASASSQVLTPSPRNRSTTYISCIHRARWEEGPSVETLTYLLTDEMLRLLMR